MSLFNVYNIVRILILFPIITLVACGSENEGATSTNNSGSNSKGYIVAGCSWLPYAPPILNFKNYNVPDAVRISVANAAGQPITTIYSYSGSFTSQADSIDTRSNTKIADSIEKYPNEYLLIECDYANDTRYYPQPFTLRGIFSISASRDETLVTSIFSDIVYKAVVKTSGSNLNAYQNILSNKFGSSSFVIDVPIFDWSVQSYKFDENSMFYQTQSLIANKGMNYVKSDFSYFTDYAASHLIGNCQDASLCSFLGVK